MKNHSKYLKTWVEVDRKAITHNFKIFRKLISEKCKLMAVVKSNAYGHGLVPFAQEMQKLGADFLGVDSVEEAFVLRKSKITRPILVFGYVPKYYLKECAQKGISITLSNFEALGDLKSLKLAKKLKIHIKIDTGLGRQGFLPSQLDKALKVLSSAGRVEVEGLYTHFAGIESKKFINYSKGQIDIFENWVHAFRMAGYNPICHASPSAGALIYPQYHFDMARVGISMYGLYSSQEIGKKTSLRGKRLKPVLSWKTVISEIKNLPKGSKVGYDLTELLKRNSVIGVCPIGYWHGYPRSLSNKGYVLIKGKRAKVLGRVSMDMIVVDLSGIDGAKRGDEVVLIGSSGRDEMSAQVLAGKAGTINYEMVTRINSEIPRIYS